MSGAGSLADALAGAMAVWFALTALSVAFVAIDIPRTPESRVLGWAFVILTLFTGPFGAFFYVLGCREPLRGTHAAYVAATWRQVLGSTMHCAAGDGLGIIAGAALAARLELSPAADLALEYALGFGFGWAFFQAFAMKDMLGGSWTAALKQTFLPELFSMNLLMAGMVPTMRAMMTRLPGAEDPLQPAFWFTMSMALIVGFLLAWPVNWWLVVNGLKHGMLTVGAGHEGRGDGSGAVPGGGAHGGSARKGGADRIPGGAHEGAHAGGGGPDAGAPAADHAADRPATGAVLAVGALSLAALAAGLALAARLGAGQGG